MAETSPGNPDDPKFIGPKMPIDILAQRNPDQAWDRLKDSLDMLNLLERNRLFSKRKLELFALACYGHIGGPDNNEDKDKIEIIQSFIEGRGDIGEIRSMLDDNNVDDSDIVRELAYLVNHYNGVSISGQNYLQGFSQFADSTTRIISGGNNSSAQYTEAEYQSNLLRDVFGNPFREVKINPDWLAWNNVIIPAMAKSIYEERKFDELPVLADALEDAGCDNTEILEHLRDPNGCHVRGCWVIDLLLGKK